MSETFLFQAIQFNQIVLIQSNQFSLSIDFVYTQLNVRTFLFQTIQFSIQKHFSFKQFISMQFSSIWLIDRTLSDATTLGQRGLGNDGNDGVVRIPKISSITGTLPSDCLLSYLGYSLWWRCLNLVQRSSRSIL